MTEIILGQDARVARWMFEVYSNITKQVNPVKGH